MDKNQSEVATRPSLWRTLPHAWAMIRPYWSSDDRWAARALLLGVVLLTLAMVYLTVLLNQWNNAFYSALQDKNMAAFRGQLFRVTYLITIFIFLAVYQVYLNQMLEIRWRRWLTDRYLRAWLTDNAYYRMQLQASETDNPDQRIAEDVQLLATHTLGLFTGGLRATVTLVTFVAILWGLSGSLTVTVWDFDVRLPGYMVWVAVLYAILGTWVTDWLGRPLVRLNFDRQRYEADFRFSLVRFRENTEGVALYRGEADELRGFRARFEDVVSNWWGIMLRQKRMTYFTSGYGLGAWIVPSIVAAPRYFRGELGLGGLMQTSQAFQQVQDALSFFVQSYKEIAAWCAVVERLAGFDRTLNRVLKQEVSGFRRVDGQPGQLSIAGLDLYRPDGQILLANVNLTVRRGDSVLLTGASGSGKSTLVRAIAGIWPFGRGEIRAARDARILFLPQRPYLPIGVLRDVVAYPMAGSGVDDAALREALEVVGLNELAARLDESAHWALRLSPGEQQRIAFARALIQKPAWLFLDEATSAVDEASEARLHRLLRERLPDTAVFSVGHRATLHSFHARRLVIQLAGNGPGSIMELPAVSELKSEDDAPVRDDERAERPW
ncbi:MAG TPA: ABC transporter ATP-binding protein/permease [Methylomirabilota bacterium]|nr:ABC transporter ATP-binding protein/permease [Methylomirabilota bacterium]